MNSVVAESYAYSERLAKRQAGNFYHAFRVLPGAERRAMCALYAFMRVADDLSDEPGSVETKRAALAEYRQQFRACLNGAYSRPFHAALHDAMTVYGIPPQYPEAVVDGVEMDLTTDRYATFDELYRYCYRVASAVGLCCIHIWGFKDPEAIALAEKAGIAFQLTNILRDLAEDAGRGRIYLPQEDLVRFGYDENLLQEGARNAAYRALMKFEAERAKGSMRNLRRSCACCRRQARLFSRSCFAPIAACSRRSWLAISMCSANAFGSVAGAKCGWFCRRCPHASDGAGLESRKSEHGGAGIDRRWRPGRPGCCRIAGTAWFRGADFGSARPLGRPGGLLSGWLDWPTHRRMSTCQYGLLH